MVDLLIRASWQGSLFVVVAWALFKLFPRIQPRYRSAVWLLVCLKFFVAPMPFVLGLPILPPVQAPAYSVEDRMPRLAHPAQSAEGSQAGQPVRGEGLAVDYSQIALDFWGVGVFVCLGYLARDGYRVRRLLRRARPGGPELVDVVDSLGVLMGIRKLPEILVSEETRSPLVVGVFKPKIVLPSSPATPLTTSDLRMAVAHELAHVRDRDLLVRWVPEAVSILFFFLPTSWLLRREWILAREADCDAAALVATAASPKAYGFLLLRFVSPTRSVGSALTMGATSGYNTLKERLQMIERNSSQSRASRVLPIALVAIALAGVLPWKVMAQGGLDPETLKATRARTMVNFKNVALATEMYAADYDRLLPNPTSTQGVFKVMRPYVTTAKVFQTYNPNGGRMLFNTALSAVSLDVIEQPAATLMLYDENAWPDGIRVAGYVDGHVHIAPASKWDELKTWLKKTFPKGYQKKHG